MAAKTYYSPFIPAFSSKGAPVPGAFLYFFRSQSDVLAPIYGDASLTTPIPNPVQADLSAKFPDIYLDDSLIYRVRQTDSAGVPLGADIDPYIPGQALKGDPGASINDVGTFAQAKQQSIPLGISTIRLSDRGKAVFERYTGSANLRTDYSSSEDYWWFRDALNNLWLLNTDSGLSMLGLGCSTSASVDNAPHFDQASIYGGLFGNTRLLLPRGNLRCSKEWRNPFGLSIEGQGKGISMIETTEFDTGALYLTGSGATFRGFTKKYNVQRGTRGSGQFYGHGITIIGATYCTVEDVLVDGSPNAGILAYASQFGRVTNCDVRDLEADGFHTASGFGSNPCTDFVWDNCTARNCGDDHFPVVSYAVDGTPVARVTYSKCQSYGGAARAFACVGGTDIVFDTCFARDAGLSGMLVDTDGTSGGTLGNTNISILDFTAINCGNDGTNGRPAYAAIQVRGLSGRDAVNVTIDSPRVVGSKNEGIRAFGLNGGTVRNLKILNPQIEGCFAAGISVDASTDLLIENGKIIQTRGQAIMATNCQGDLRLIRNSWEAVGTAGTNECLITSAGLGRVRQIIGNSSRVGNRRPENGQVLQSTAFIVARFDGQDIQGNYAEDGKIPEFGSDGLTRQRDKAAAQPDSVNTAAQAASNPAALTDAVTKAEFNAFVSKYNALLGEFNTLLSNRRNAGEQL